MIINFLIIIQDLTMCCDNREQLLDQLNPTFLFTWKGTRLKDEARYHSHDFIEMAFILSGHGKYKIADRLYDVSEGDIIILNPGQKHQALCTDPSNPATEFLLDYVTSVLGISRKIICRCI